MMNVINVARLNPPKESLKGRTFSEDTRIKFSKAKKGKSWKLVDGHRVWYIK